ncbi:hypothetical protein RhiJN_12918 [Ceratobasidium sp. AG-Ba]|nr:hypothetical protein RhiJN_12918 [Ceratobasidium sp. AG-Ba]
MSASLHHILGDHARLSCTSPSIGPRYDYVGRSKNAASTSRRSPTRPPSGNGQSEVKTPRYHRFGGKNSGRYLIDLPVLDQRVRRHERTTLCIPKPRHHRPPNIQLLDPENAPQLWQRSPTRQSTEDIELQDRSNSRGPKESKEPKERPGSRFSSSSRGPSPVKAPADKDSVLDVPSWRGDIATFTDAVIAHPESRNYKVYKIQARKSRKLPFKRVSARTWENRGNIGLRQGHRAALEEVHIFDLEHPDAEDWLYDTKRNGSQPIATLMASPPPGAPWPTLSLVDIARMFKFIQVEMPTYVLTTKNCFMMTRSILMILCTCFGDGYFTCYLEDENSDKNRILAKELVEPLYNGIVAKEDRKSVSGLRIYSKTLDSAPLEESESSKHSFKPYLVLLVLTVGGSIVLGVYWDKGLMVAVALCIIFLLMCALQGDGISADMESYVRLDNDEGDLNV